VSNAGDVNGDGYDDLIIGVPYAARCYVLFGTVQGFANMTTGFTILGVSGDLTGWSASKAGDCLFCFDSQLFYSLVLSRFQAMLTTTQ
jgi:hypothetical protein